MCHLLTIVNRYESSMLGLHSTDYAFTVQLVTCGHWNFSHKNHENNYFGNGCESKYIVLWIQHRCTSPFTDLYDLVWGAWFHSLISHVSSDYYGRCASFLSSTLAVFQTQVSYVCFSTVFVTLEQQKMMLVAKKNLILMRKRNTQLIYNVCHVTLWGQFTDVWLAFTAVK